MKTSTFFVLALLLASCASPRYTYYFDRYQHPLNLKVDSLKTARIVIPEQYVLYASTSAEVVPIERSLELAPVLGNLRQLERKNGLKKNIDQNSDQAVSPEASDSSTPRNLRLSLLFGVSGIAALIAGGHALWVLGSISLIIGVIFFLKWLVRR